MCFMTRLVNLNRLFSRVVVQRRQNGRRVYKKWSLGHINVEPCKVHVHPRACDYSGSSRTRDLKCSDKDVISLI